MKKRKKKKIFKDFMLWMSVIKYENRLIRILDMIASEGVNPESAIFSTNKEGNDTTVENNLKATPGNCVITASEDVKINIHTYVPGSRYSITNRSKETAIIVDMPMSARALEPGETITIPSEKPALEITLNTVFGRLTFQDNACYDMLCRHGWLNEERFETFTDVINQVT
jgi:hypothetical protein